MSRKNSFLILYFILSFVPGIWSQVPLWIAEKGHVAFESAAPLEIIKAQSKTLRGIINPANRSFAFTININSFEGFNSQVQQTHFMENYLEWKRYPQATFKGKLIEDIPFDTPGTYSIRAKGDLEIHGVTKERIIRGTLTIGEHGGRIETQFTILVSDHGIAIPKIVQQKIAEEIQIEVALDFEEQKKS